MSFVITFVIGVTHHPELWRESGCLRAFEKRLDIIESSMDNS